MRWIATVVVVWTAVIIAAAIVVGTSLATPSCAHLVAPPPSCAVEIAAANDQAWITHTLPLLLLALAGYVVIFAVGVSRARRGRRATSSCP